MEPNLHDGQYVLVNKTAYWFGRDPGRGDVIILDAPDDPDYDRIKRVIGLPGETVEVRPDGSVYIDGQYLEEPYLPEDAIGRTGTWTVPEGQYFVLGDNRSVSYDSRSWGALPRENVVGKAWFIIWPLSAWGGAPNYSLVPDADEPQGQTLAPGDSLSLPSLTTILASTTMLPDSSLRPVRQV